MNKLIVLGIAMGFMSSSSAVLAASTDYTRLPAAQITNQNVPANNSAVNTIDKKKKKKKTAAQKTSMVKSSSAKPSVTKAPVKPSTTKPPLAKGQIQKPVLTPVQLAAQRMSAQKLAAPKTLNLHPKNLYAQNTTVPATTSSDASTGGSFKGLTFPNSQGVSKTTVTAPAEPEEKKNPFSFKYLSINAENIDASEAPKSSSSTLDHEVQAWDRFYFTYNFNNDISTYVMPQLFHTWFGDPGRPQDSNNPNNPGLSPYASYLGDTELVVKDTKLATLPGGLVLEGVVGWYFPTSQASQQSDQMGQSATALSVGRSWGIIDFKWTENLWYYFQGYQTSTLRDSTGQLARNNQYALWSLLDGTLNITKKFYFDLTAGFMNRALYADDSDPTNLRPQVLNDYIILDPEIGYAFNSVFTLAVGIWDQYDMRSASQIGTNPANPATGVPASPIYVASYTPFASWNGGSQFYLSAQIKF